MTVDPVEHRGFEYQTGISFIFFTRDGRGELGRGGRYTTELPNGGSESSTGFTLFMDTVLRVLPEPQPPRRLYLPAGDGPADGGRDLRDQGWVTVAGLEPDGDIAGTARRLGCSHALIDSRIVALED